MEASDLRGRPALFEDLEEGFAEEEAEFEEGRGGLNGLGGIVVVNAFCLAYRGRCRLSEDLANCVLRSWTGVDLEGGFACGC